MRPFNLQEAKEHPERIVYRNGKKPASVFFTPKNNIISTQIDSADHAPEVNYPNGEFIINKEHSYDLFLEDLPTQPEPELYTVLFENGKHYSHCKLFTKKEKALSCTSDVFDIKGVYKLIKIE